MPTAGAPSRPRSPTFWSACRPLVLIVGMLSTKDCAGFLKNSPGLARRIIAVPFARAKSAAALADIARNAAIPAMTRDDLQRARSRWPASSTIEPAPHPHHRLALSGRRSAGRQRHAAAVNSCKSIVLRRSLRASPRNGDLSALAWIGALRGMSGDRIIWPQARPPQMQLRRGAAHHR